MAVTTLKTVLEADVDADAITADSSTVVGASPIDGVVTEVAFIPNADKAGADTSTRTLTLYNDGQADADAPVSVATFAMTSGVNLDQGVSVDLTLSGTPANLVLVAGDVLRLESDHASSGLTQPGGVLRVSVRPSWSKPIQGSDRTS